MSSAGPLSTLEPVRRTRADVIVEPDLLRSLRGMVRRRVPEADVEDIVQAALCDALAAPVAPADPDEVPRWVTAIAKNKIADHFRRARREERLEVVPAQAVHEPHDERAMLREIAGEARTPGNLKTLSWIVREASGEQLAEIAAEEQLPPEVVRQRVSRWRKRLRTTFLIAAASLAVFFVARTFWPSQVDPQSQTAAPTRISGNWRIVEASIPEGADPRLRQLAGFSTSKSRLVVSGSRARFETLGVGIDRAYSLETVPADVMVQRGTMTTFDGKVVPFVITYESETSAVITGGGARFKLAR